MTATGPMIWTAGAVVLGSLALLLNWRPTRLRFLAAVALVFVYLQVSALFFQLPYYKDGGNGTLSDADVWLLQSLFFNLWLLTIATTVRAIASHARRRKSAGSVE